MYPHDREGAIIGAVYDSEEKASEHLADKEAYSLYKYSHYGPAWCLKRDVW